MKLQTISRKIKIKNKMLDSLRTIISWIKIGSFLAITYRTLKKYKEDQPKTTGQYILPYQWQSIF